MHQSATQRRMRGFATSALPSHSRRTSLDILKTSCSAYASASTCSASGALPSHRSSGFRSCVIQLRLQVMRDLAHQPAERRDADVRRLARALALAGLRGQRGGLGHLGAGLIGALPWETHVFFLGGVFFEPGVIWELPAQAWVVGGV